MSLEEIQQNKEIEFYAAGAAAWYNTQLEHDKSLLTLSAGGVGILITLLVTIGVASADGLVLNITALLSFLVCIGAVLVIFRRNGPHLQGVLRDANHADPWLKGLDGLALITFGFGVLLSAVIGISAAIDSYATKGKSMASNQKDETQFEKSFYDAARLKPAALQDSTTSTTGSMPPGTTAPKPPDTGKQ